MSNTVRLPRLLRKQIDGIALKEVGRLHPTALSVTLDMDPLSTADMTLTMDDLPVQVHDLAELYGQNGSLGIFRVVNISIDSTGERRIRLNHALDILADALIPDQEDMTGTVYQILAHILSCQTAKLNGIPFWQLGTVQDSACYTLSVQWSNALDALKQIAEDEDKYGFAYDFSTFPWTLHFIRRDDTVLSEFRLSRNTEQCTITLDDSRLCTRLYLSIDTQVTDDTGTQTITTHEVYNDTKAQAVWGIVVRTAGIDTVRITDREAWVNRYFERYGQPMVQISLSGTELNRLTGEDLDRIKLGHICRVVLPQYHEVFIQRIITLQYPDILRHPERIMVQLANRRISAERTFSSMGRSIRSVSSSMIRNAKNIEKNSYSLRATDRHVTDIGVILHAAGLEIDPHGVWLYASEQGPEYALGASFKVQADAITAEVARAGAAEGVLSSRITQTANSIISEVTRATEAEGTLSSRITQTASDITTLVSKTGINSLGQNETLYSKVTQTASDITSEVTRATGAESSLSSRITQTAADITTLVGKTGINSLGQNETLYSKVTQTASDITSEVTRATGVESSLSSRITQTAADITTLVSKTGINSLGQNETLYSKVTQTSIDITSEVTRATGAESSLSSRITQNANSISLVVGSNGIKAASIVAAVNDAGSSVVISADKVDIAGYLTAHTVQVDGLSSTKNILSQGWVVAGSYVNAGTDVQINSVSLKSAIVGFGTASENGGEISIPTTTFGGTAGPNINFNIAATQTYKSGVAAAKNSMGVIIDKDNGRKVKVGTATKQYVVIGVTAGDPIYSTSTHKYSFSTSAKADDTIMQSASKTTGTEAYDAGVASVTIPSANITEYQNAVYNSTTHNTTVYIQAEASNGKSRKKTFTVSGADAYSAGQTNGAAGVSINSVTSTGTSYDSTTNKYTISLKATASNNATKTGTTTITATDAYNAGAASIVLTTGYPTSNGWLTPPTGYSGFSSVYVNVSAGSYERLGWDHYGALYEHSEIDGYSRVGSGYWFLVGYNDRNNVYKKLS